MNTRDILVKKPWRRIRPDGYLEGAEDFRSDIYTQADMRREYYPSGHIINSQKYYPDIYREVFEPVYDAQGNPTGNKVRRVYRECVPRYAFAFEQIITLKQIIHLCGNDVQCDLGVSKPTKKQLEDYEELRMGWVKRDMEIALYESVRSEKTTADTAFVGFVADGKFGFKTLSFNNGDVLYPHFDSITGKLKCFARRFSSYDDDGAELTQWLEVWDEKYLYRYKRNAQGNRTLMDLVAGLFRVDGWQRVGNPEPHGFPFIPVAYKRNEDGPCWSASRDSIDSYDLSFSQMAHNNEAFGEPIMVLQGEGDEIDVQHGLNGTIKTLSMGPESKASYLEGQSAADSYQKQLDTLYKMIYEQSFTVIPPEMKSGDLPGVALKLLYSPAYEKAMSDAADWQRFLNDMCAIFVYGYGLEMGKTIDYTSLPLKWWLKPYIHINESAIVQDLATAVQNGFCSRQTAAERNSTYSTVGEWERIIKEQKEQEKADLLYQMKINETKVDTAAPDGGESEQKKIENEEAE